MEEIKIDRQVLSSIKGVLFDMDGTLTVPLNKTAKIKAQFHIPDKVDIFEFVKVLPDEERTKAWAFFDKVETESLPKMRLKPHVTELLHFLHKNKINLALMTKSSTKSVKQFKSLLKNQDNTLPDSIFSHVIARDIVDGTPLKPDPQIVDFLCDKWSIKPNNLLVVGDRKEDMECGHSKRAVTVLVVNEGMILSDFPFEKCKVIVSSISRLIEILQK